MSTKDHEELSNVEHGQSLHAEEPYAERKRDPYDVAPANVGDIEISFELDTDGLNETEIQKLRERAYSHERHSRLLDTIIKSALGPFGQSGWVKWAFCRSDAEFTSQWQTKEKFTKTYKIIPNYGKEGNQEDSEIAIQTKVTNPYGDKGSEIHVKATRAFVDEVRKRGGVQTEGLSEFVETLALQTLEGNQKKGISMAGVRQILFGLRPVEGSFILNQLNSDALAQIQPNRQADVVWSCYEDENCKCSWCEQIVVPQSQSP